MSSTEKSAVRIAVIDLSKQRVKLLEAVWPDCGFGGYEAALSVTGGLRSRPVLCVLTGPLTGTGAPGSGCYGFMWREKTRSGLAFTEGRLGPMMKFAGINHLIIHGHAETPVYLSVEGESASICDAAGLQDMDIAQMTDFLYAQSDYGDASVLAFTEKSGGVLVEDYRFEHHSAEIRDIFESMNLKAVVAGGAGSIPIGRPKEFLKECIGLYSHKPAPEKGPGRYGDGAATGFYLSPWRKADGKIEPVNITDNDESLAPKLAGLFWDEAFPLPDAASYAAKLLSCVLSEKWDAKKLETTAKRIHAKAV